MTPPLAAPGGPNDGFLREDAGLRIIYVDDEDDQSPDPVADYVTTLQSLKVDPDRVSLAALVDPTQSTRWSQAVTSTNGIQEDISGANWFNLVSNLASFCTSRQNTFKLSHTPVVESLAVWTGPASLPWGWYYDAVLNAVTRCSTRWFSARTTCRGRGALSP